MHQSEQFTRDLEALYRRMWQAWCRGEKLTDRVVQALLVALLNGQFVLTMPFLIGYIADIQIDGKL